MSFSVQGQHVVVAGGGRSGLAAAALLASKGAAVTLSDTQAPGAAGELDALRAQGVTVDVGPHRPELFSSAQLVVLSPGVPPEQPAVDAARRRGIPVIGEIELASRWLSGRVIAITGTKGKSTTTTLAALMLKEAGLDATAGGNLGTALSTQVSTSHPGALHVVEVSSFQLETTDTFHPWIAVLVNLSPDHLDRHVTFEAYAAAKARIFSNQTREDWAVVNADDPAALALAGGRARRFDFGMDAAVADGVTVHGDTIVRCDGGRASALVPLSAVRLPGRHLLADVLAASAVACLSGVPPAAMQRAVEGFSGLPHALERVVTVDGVTFVNDSKATNIASAQRAIESFARGVVVILGGRYKGGRFEDLASVVADKCAAVVAIGEARGLVRAALEGVVPVHDADSMGEAVRQARALAPAGGTVLLAPACSSFDMFVDYQARGRAFAEEVRRMSDGQSSVQAPR